MPRQEFDFIFHKTNFYGQYWKSDTAKAVIVLVHGMGEHSSRYADYVIPTFLKSNFSVITYDQFGHGRTKGKRGHNPGYSYLLECIDVVINKANDFFGSLPIFLYGHSMGGNLVINYTLRQSHNLAGIIATSPFLKLAFEPPKWKITLGKMLHKILPNITMDTGLDVNAISRREEEVKKYMEDPLVHDKISPNYSLSVMEAGVWAINNANTLQTPLLLLHGTGDKLTSYKTSEEFAKSSNENTTLKLFQGGYHELHNDLCREEFLKTIIQWMDTQLTS